MTPRLLVTPRSMSSDRDHWTSVVESYGFEAVWGPAGRQPSPSELKGLLEGVVAWVAGTEAITSDILAFGNSLEVISRNGVGTDSIDVRELQKRGIELRVALGANSRSVAELAIGLLFSLARWVPQGHISVREGTWSRQVGRELHGGTIAVIGLGAIGRLVADLAATLGMTVLGVDISSDTRLEGLSIERVSLSEALPAADALSLHIPPIDDGPLLATAQLNRLKVGALVVNTARSVLVDPEAMFEALEEGRVGGYAVDAFDSEPPELGPLERHERVICTPHLGGLTLEAVERAGRMAIENARDALIQRES